MKRKNYSAPLSECLPFGFDEDILGSGSPGSPGHPGGNDDIIDDGDLD